MNDLRIAGKFLGLVLTAMFALVGPFLCVVSALIEDWALVGAYGPLSVLAWAIWNRCYGLALPWLWLEIETTKGKR